MNSSERRIRNLEKSIPKRTASFRANRENLDNPIDADDPCLKRGVEVFGEYLAGNGKNEKRGRAYLNRWTIVKFWDGGNRKAWNRALALLRSDPDLSGETYGLIGSVCFTEANGEVVRSGGLLILLGRYDRPGWRNDTKNESPPKSFTFNFEDDV